MKRSKFWLAAVLVAGSSCEGFCEGGGVTGTQQFRLTVEVKGTGAGSVSSNIDPNLCSTTKTPCARDHGKSTTVTLTAQADPGSEFAGWSGGASDCNASATQASIAVLVDQNKVCTATFDKQPEVTVLLTGSGTGRVTSSPTGIDCPGTCGPMFVAKGSTVTLTATPGPSSIFGDWSGSGCTTSINQQITLTVVVNAPCTARFDHQPGFFLIADDFDDGLAALARWDIALRDQPAGTLTSESNPTTGGFPSTGGYREGRHDFSVGPPPTLTSRVDHILRGDATHPGRYDPAVNGGPVDHLVVSMDRLITHAPNPNAQAGSAFVLRQGTQLFYVSIDLGSGFNNTTWQRVTKTLVASDFTSGGTPNFNAPMEFGFRRTVTFSSGTAPIFLTWGTDNFRVEVWR